MKLPNFCHDVKKLNFSYISKIAKILYEAFMQFFEKLNLLYDLGNQFLRIYYKIKNAFILAFHMIFSKGLYYQLPLPMFSTLPFYPQQNQYFQFNYYPFQLYTTCNIAFLFKSSIIPPYFPKYLHRYIQRGLNRVTL